MRLIPSLLKASDAELAAFRAQVRSRLMVPPETPPEDRFRVPQTRRTVWPLQVMPSRRLLCNGGTVGSSADLDRGKGVHHRWFCWVHRIGWPAIGDCTHPMIEK